ncbi:DNA modification methylase [Roseinatronobacter thiooxidans]|uniref:Methyltransferase n=1 Tax=Roseinatronobacter thiooxidans TaxID=121821 RepID=A0A2W7PJ70_9RHOB|nr:site-specific DNA-methyltransferase [Roseinatronobacter thiooxidans]PZX36291.1 DNA modification methylase [Roseinatronobacter thiooxidans]
MTTHLRPSQIAFWPLDRLKPYARNAKTHDANQVARIAASMAEFGWTVPCLVAADGELIAGHGRVLAAAQLGLAEAPVIVLDHLTEAQRRAYRIADNRLTELGGWDDALLVEELRGLLAEDFDLGLIGIPEDELDALLNDADDNRAPIDNETADAIPEPPAEPITTPGDIWALGDHRLICGDATDPVVVARLMDGAQASRMFTSPPYAQQRNYGAAKEKVGDWDALMQGVFAAAPVIADVQLLVNLGLVHRDSEWIPYWDGWLNWMRAQGWRRFGWYVWDQGPGLPCDWNGRLAPSHEFIFHFNRAPRKPHKTVPSKHAGETLGGGGLRGADGTVHRKTGFGNAIQSHRIPDSVFRIMRHKGGLGAAGSHPAVFPVALVEAVLEAFTDPGDLIFEPFCGSGTQLIAAERTGRRCFAVELDPVYCDVAVRRWELATGRIANRIVKEEEAQKPPRRSRKRA